MLIIDRDYTEQLVDSEITWALNIPRERALNLNQSVKKKNELPVYVSIYDPRLPIINKSIQKHWNTSWFLDSNLKKKYA